MRVVVLVVVVVAGGAVAGEEVGVTLPVQGNGVPSGGSGLSQRGAAQAVHQPR